MKLTSLGIGTATFGGSTSESDAAKILDLAYERGIRFVDTADGYPQVSHALGDSERILGRWLRDTGVRPEVTVATKVNYPMGPGLNQRGLSRANICAAVRASLERLGCDWIDLYQAHQVDLTTPVAETVRAFDSLVRDGLIRYYGVANWPAWKLIQARAYAARFGLEPPISLQARYNLLDRTAEKEMLPACRDENVGFIAFNALAGGMLTGRYRPGDVPSENERFGQRGRSSDGQDMGERYRQRYWTDRNFDMLDRLAEAAKRIGISQIAIAIRWVLAQPGVTSIILGASRPDQLAGQFDHLDVALSDEDLADILNSAALT